MLLTAYILEMLKRVWGKVCPGSLDSFSNTVLSVQRLGYVKPIEAPRN